jgi:hypothetical protein
MALPFKGAAEAGDVPAKASPRAINATTKIARISTLLRVW